MNTPLHLLEGRGSGYILHCKKDSEMFSFVCNIPSSIFMKATHIPHGNNDDDKLKCLSEAWPKGDGQ